MTTLYLVFIYSKVNQFLFKMKVNIIVLTKKSRTWFLSSLPAKYKEFFFHGYLQKTWDSLVRDRDLIIYSGRDSMSISTCTDQACWCKSMGRVHVVHTVGLHWNLPLLWVTKKTRSSFQETLHHSLACLFHSWTWKMAQVRSSCHTQKMSRNPWRTIFWWESSSVLHLKHIPGIFSKEWNYWTKSLQCYRLSILPSRNLLL